MKRDMDLIRRIVLATAALPYEDSLNQLDGVPEEEFVMHVIWLKEAGMIEAIAMDGRGSHARYAHINRLTWAGCEFADAIQSDTIWEKAKKDVIRPGLSFTVDVLKDWLKSEISQGLPTLRGFGNQLTQ